MGNSSLSYELAVDGVVDLALALGNLQRAASRLNSFSEVFRARDVQHIFACPERSIGRLRGAHRNEVCKRLDSSLGAFRCGRLRFPPHLALGGQERFAADIAQSDSPLVCMLTVNLLIPYFLSDCDAEPSAFFVIAPCRTLFGIYVPTVLTSEQVCVDRNGDENRMGYCKVVRKACKDAIDDADDERTALAARLLLREFEPDFAMPNVLREFQG